MSDLLGNSLGRCASGPFRYTELHAHSAFTFLEATDQPKELVAQALALGLDGLAVLDVDGMYSAVQTAHAGKTASLPIIHGSELTLRQVEFDDPAQQRSPRRMQVFVGGAPEHGALERGALESAFLETPELSSEEKSRTRVRIEKGVGLKPGSEDPGVRLPVLATSQRGYRTLCSLLSSHFLAEPGRRNAAFHLEEISNLIGADNHLWALTGTTRGPLARALRSHGLWGGREVLERLKATFGNNKVAVELNLQPHISKQTMDQLALLAKESRLPLVATGAVRAAIPSQSQLGDVLAATRLRMSLDEAEPHLPAFRSFLRSPEEMHELCRRYPEAIDNALMIGQECAFDLELLEPGLPSFPVPEGHTEESWLRHLTYQGAYRLYGSSSENREAWDLINHELQIIEKLGFSGYFLIVKDIVDYCQEQNILCQGRGSAANSAVCYSLQITAVDAVKHKMLFERFLSPDRVEAPDIDLDIEAGQREQVIQYVYRTYGRTNAAQVANVISYRPKSAIRDAGRALGYPEGVVRRWSKTMERSRCTDDAQDSPRSPNQSGEIPQKVLQIGAQLQRLPRHMGLHPGGMVLTGKPVSEVCPVMWAAKEGRTVLQWDKEDCADAGLVKFDLLGLGMLTALRRAFTWLEEEGITRNGRALDLYNIPDEDPRVYDLLCAAETVGVFQVESRAQMNTLPRLKPRYFYDIVIEVALIRPGPIQGQAVNPYLRRKNGREPVQYLHPLMKPALEKTLGVPLFQEQLMQIAVDVAGFTPGQADQLRRAIGSKRSSDRMMALKPALDRGMTERGVPDDVQAQIFEQLKGFAEFGFPESHAFSFAFLVYASAWLKVHHPEHFYAGLLASQPMGFYSPSTLVEDARRHGVKVNPPSVVYSEVLTVPQKNEGEKQRGERGQDAAAATRHRTNVSKRLVLAHDDQSVRLGLETIHGLGEAANRICEARKAGPWASLADLAARAALTESQVEKLARAGALEDLGVSRREGLWAASVVGRPQWEQPYIPGTEPGLVKSSLPEMTEAEEVMADFAAMGLSTTKHPMELVRRKLQEQGVRAIAELSQMEPNVTMKVGGVVTHRQRPATAHGTTFLSLEDETGLANVICSPGLWKRYRQIAVESPAIIVQGQVETGDGAIALIAQKLQPLPLPVATRSRDFR